MITAVLFGLLPALRLSKYGEVGHTSAAQLSAVARTSRLGPVLAAVQLTFAMALLIGAGLLVNSFMQLTGIDTGFDARNALSFSLVVPGDSTAARKLELAEALVTRLEGDSRVTSAGFADIPPLTPGIILFSASFVPQGMTQAQMQEEQRTQTPNERTQTRIVSPGYLRALGARLVAGSWLDERTTSDPAVLVSRPYAEHYFPDGNAVGATMTSGQNAVTIAGVLDNLHLGGLEGRPERAVFIDARQMLASRPALPPQVQAQADRQFLTIGGSSITFAARTTGDPLAILTDLRAIVRDIDPRLAIDAAAPMERVVSSLTTRPRFYAVLLSTFGAIAGFIAVIGIYGVLSYIVTQRTREIGVRMALGAQRRNVLKLVLKQGTVIVAIGVVAGVAGAAGQTRYDEGMLFGLSALDGATLAVVAAAFAAVALLAAYLPAQRAATINPLQALRHE
jgi:predicted permease